MKVTNFAQSLCALIGRIFFSLIFIISGFNLIVHFDANLAELTQRHAPFSLIMLIVGIIFSFAGGVMVLVGWKTRWGALMLFLKLIFALIGSQIFRNPVSLEPTFEIVEFFEQLALAGGALYILAFGSGKYSVDQRKKVKHETTQS